MGLTLWLSGQEGVCGRGCQATGRAPGRGLGVEEEEVLGVAQISLFWWL